MLTHTLAHNVAVYRPHHLARCQPRLDVISIATQSNDNTFNFRRTGRPLHWSFVRTATVSECGRLEMTL